MLAWDRHTGESDVLTRCRVQTEPYRFVGTSHASQTMTSSTKLDLGVHFPFAGPVNLGAMLEKFGEINVEYHTIGEYKLDVDRVHADDLEGDCAGASHVVVALSVGAFEFFAGDKVGGRVDADVPMAAGASGGAERKHENLDRGGDPLKCGDGARGAQAPLDGCDAIVAIELMAIERDSPFVAGDEWQGHYECGARKAASDLLVREVADDGTVEVLVSFDYADTAGSFVARGKPGEDGSLVLTFERWEKQPSDFVPITPTGRVDAATGEFTGTLPEDGCGEFSYVRRR